ncbi:hypothetical protein KDA_44530 [Dictyobacter alpinus]|uniref:Uncharacterized protein n=1 Tax=Dictyobacter alpinus TaxID=2014873 RepID=A0A402BC98_9CHLR|nr:hypothetical protein [Dictyobacter alpinus]GCE28969.1 hypothetical protein KDA_44530 [Dictyobacter alpinus]
MGYEMQPSFLRRRILVAAAPDDLQAIALVKTMRSLGLTVMMAATVGLAAQADEVAACVVILHPDKWRGTPPIITAMRQNPRYMIPVLEEPMILPRARWATEPFYLTEAPLETAKALVALIRQHLQNVLEQEQAIIRQQDQLHPWLRYTDPCVPVIQPPKKPVRTMLHYLLLSWPLAFVLCVSFLAYYFFQLNATINTQAVNTTTMVTTTWRDHPYLAPVPGAQCDPGGADWVIPDATTSESSVVGRATPTPHLKQDNSTISTCQQDGVLLTRRDHYDAFASMVFASKGLPLPQHYTTQITATPINTSPAAVFKLGIRDQASSDLSRTGYGNEVLQLGVNGAWELVRYSAGTNTVEKRYARGFVKPAQDYKLSADSNGPVMTFSINDQYVATIIDATYHDSYGISFGLRDPEAHTPPSALFSHFSYIPLPISYAGTPEASGSATAQAIKDGVAAIPYSASVPGASCDPGTAQWQPTSVAEQHISTRCQSNGLSVMQKKGSSVPGRIPFYGQDGNFSTNYRLQVALDLKRSNNSWAGLTTRMSGVGLAGYACVIRSDGNWRMLRYDSSGGEYQLAAGHVARHTSYIMETVSDGETQSLSINGVRVAAIQDSSFITTDHVELIVQPDSKHTGSTTVFSNFVFTPQPSS